MKKVSKYVVVTLFVLGLALFVSNSYVFAAGTSTGYLGVSASVASSCSVGASSLSFGVYNASADLNGTGAINVICTSGTTYHLTLDGGSNSAHVNTTYGQWALVSGGSNYLSYDLSTTSDISTGLIAPTVQIATEYTGTGSQVATPIYGIIRSGQTSAPGGSYIDLINITLNYD
jgi:spore coat protein U-like protein